jgi:hypothetical protein
MISLLHAQVCSRVCLVASYTSILTAALIAVLVQLVFANTYTYATTLCTVLALSVQDITPPGYQPEFFQEAEADAFQGWGEPVPDGLMNINMGSVKTPYHSLRLRYVCTST